MLNEQLTISLDRQALRMVCVAFGKREGRLIH
jgi:hypothetical protein